MSPLPQPAVIIEKPKSKAVIIDIFLLDFIIIIPYIIDVFIIPHSKLKVNKRCLCTGWFRISVKSEIRYFFKVLSLFGESCDIIKITLLFGGNDD